MESLSYDTNFRGLENRLGVNNCYMNVVIQSLWHLFSFRVNFLSYKSHRHSDKEIYLRVRRATLIRERKLSHAEALQDPAKPSRRKSFNAFDYEEEKFTEIELENRHIDIVKALDLSSLEEAMLASEARGKITKEHIKAVKQSDVCLFCNLYDLFTKYEYDTNTVIQPKKVRSSLESIFFEQNEDFSAGKMGCA